LNLFSPQANEPFYTLPRYPFTQIHSSSTTLIRSPVHFVTREI
jgi:hypothetical protein